MTYVWEIRVFGHDFAGTLRRRNYIFVREAYDTASSEAKRLARLDGLTDVRVWAATRIREVPAETAERETRR